MNCTNFQEQLLNQVAVNPNDEMRMHLTSCSECREAAALVEQFNEQVTSEKQIESNPFIAERIIARLQNPQAENKTAYRKGLIRLAFTLIAGILFGILTDLWIATDTNESVRNETVATTDDLLNPDENLLSLND